MQNFWLSLGCTAMLAGQAVAQLPDRIPPDLKVIKDVVYKTADGKPLDLWLFSPTGKHSERIPIVVYVHGGGWGKGDKSGILRRHVIDVVRRLTRSGVACATIEYRLADGGKATAYDSAADCKDAVRFLAKNADRYGLDPTRIGLFGSSAGGHLALVTALGPDQDYPCDRSLDGQPGLVRCVAAYYPCTSFVHPEVLKGSNFERPRRFVPILGGPLDEKRDIARKLSPVELLTKESPAIFLAHGDADEVLSVKNSKLMEAAAREKGVTVECVVMKGGGHGFRGTDVSPSEAEVSERTAAFFFKHLTR